MGKIMHELEIIRMPEETPKPIAMSWSDIAKAIHAEKEFGGELQKNKYFLDDLRNIIKENDTLETKMTKVFNHVKNKMNWDGKLGYWTKIGVEKAYAEKVGNVAEINLILTAMLRLSGLEAHPIILSTKDNGVALFPNKTFLNYIITSVNINGKVYLLDATDKVSDINLLPVRALNQFGILIKNDGTAEEIPLLPKSVSLTATTIMAEINNNAEVIGKVRNQYAAYSAYFFKDKSQGVSSESLMESLEKKYAGLEVSNYSLTKNNDLSKPLVESYSFVSTNAIEKIGDTMYIAPFLFLTQTENPFKQETRKYPIDFIYPSQTKYNINLKIPPGYSLEKLPKPKALSLPENLGSMRYNISLSDNMIQILYTFEVSQASINADYYEALKSFYKEIINKQTEKIVLKKG
jgi:hypothetical protein